KGCGHVCGTVYCPFGGSDRGFRVNCRPVACPHRGCSVSFSVPAGGEIPSAASQAGSASRIEAAMKDDIHPNYQPVVFMDTSNGTTFLTRSTIRSKEKITWEDGNEYPLVKVDI